jgi:hypothetical protein
MVVRVLPLVVGVFALHFCDLLF